jgi:hypothetical protein
VDDYRVLNLTWFKPPPPSQGKCGILNFWYMSLQIMKLWCSWYLRKLTLSWLLYRKYIASSLLCIETFIMCIMLVF